MIRRARPRRYDTWLAAAVRAAVREQGREVPVITATSWVTRCARSRGYVVRHRWALAVSRTLRGLVYGVGVTDPVSFGAAAGTLIVVALLATWIPARRASRVEPIIALRAD